MMINKWNKHLMVAEIHSVIDPIRCKDMQLILQISSKKHKDVRFFVNSNNYLFLTCQGSRGGPVKAFNSRGH